MKIKCMYCKGKDAIKYGIRRNKEIDKQVYKCRSCSRKFVINDGFRYRTYNPEAITVAIDLYVKGVSLRDTADHLGMVYGTKPSHTTILAWIREYGEIIDAYTKGLGPKLGSVWSADEMQIHMKNNKQFSMPYGNWLINLIDKRTRFLIISEPRTFRDSSSIRETFSLAKVFYGKPKVIVTDGLHSYRGAIKKSFGKDVKHIVAKGPGKKKNQSSRIERLNGTIRQREKVTRNYWRVSTTKKIMRSYRAYYNFIRPNMALNGRTPAEAAGMDLGLDGNRWKGLIERSCAI